MKKVAMLIETSRGYGRGILRGAVKYSRQHGPWSFYVAPGTLQQSLPEISELDGVIARVDSPAVSKAILRTKIPTIVHDPPAGFTVPKHKKPWLIDMHPNPGTISTMAAEHLIGLGLKNFAYCGEAGTIWSQQRQAEFLWYIETMKMKCSVFEQTGGKNLSWQTQVNQIARWLESLPKPLGVFAPTDVRGQNVLDACMHAGLKVPDEVAVIGVDNDELFCDLCQPPLSSIELDGVWAGFESARLLDAMMNGQPASESLVFVEPRQIVQRLSTDMLAIDDGEIAQAVRFIRQNVNKSIGVTDVATHVAMSRRSLEMRFKKAFKTTVSAEIQRVRMQRARELLTSTDMPIAQVAKLSGFGSDTYMGAVFRKKLSMTPMKYRRTFRT